MQASDLRTELELSGNGSVRVWGRDADVPEAYGSLPTRGGITRGKKFRSPRAPREGLVVLVIRSCSEVIQ